MTKRKSRKQPWIRRPKEPTPAPPWARDRKVPPPRPWPPEWKPVEKCPETQLGLLGCYLKPWDLEKAEGDGIETLKRFLKQVRESRGYDVDCTPARCFTRSPFWPVPPRLWMDKNRASHRLMMECVEFAIREINAQAQKHGEEYELKDLVRFVDVMSYNVSLFTFNVMEVEPNAGVVKTVQALVSNAPSMGYDLLEWRFKPGPPDAVPDPNCCNYISDLTLPDSDDEIILG